MLRSLADPAVPAEQRARMARAVAGVRGRPVVEALVQTAADAEPEVAEAGLETLCAIWRREGVVGEDLLLKLDPGPGPCPGPRGPGAEPLVRTAAIGRA